jgi:hypothetical protein
VDEAAVISQIPPVIIWYIELSSGVTVQDESTVKTLDSITKLVCEPAVVTGTAKGLPVTEEKVVLLKESTA